MTGDNRPEYPPIDFWRDAWNAFRTPGCRLYALPVATAMGAVYAMCMVLAVLVGAVAARWIVGLALTSVFGRVPAPDLTPAICMALIGGPMFWANVWLVERCMVKAGPRIDKYLAKLERQEEQP